jgi:hypothetical protein
MVVMKLGVNESSQNRSSKQLFPTPTPESLFRYTTVANEQQFD